MIDQNHIFCMRVHVYLLIVTHIHTYIKSYRTSIVYRIACRHNIIFLFFSRETSSRTHCKNNNDNDNNITSFLLDGGKNKKKHLHKLEPTDGRSRVCFSARTESFSFIHTTRIYIIIVL